MPIKVACSCGKKLAVKDELAGKKVKCPACQKLLSIPKPKVQAESLDDEWDLGDSAEEDFEDEPSDAPVKSRGGKSSALRGEVSRKSTGKGKGKKSKSSNRGLLIGVSAGGGVLVIALLSWMLWPEAPAANVAGDPPANQEQTPAPASGDTVKPINSFPQVVGAQQPLTLNGHIGLVYGVAFSADGKRLASTSGNSTTGEVKLWDAESSQELLTLKGHTGYVYSVGFSADGKRLASASFDQTVKVWDASSGQETLTLKGHTGLVWSVVFSVDGKRLASASWDQTVKVWDATSGQETLTLKGHTDKVMSVALNVDGKRMASASDDRTVKVWDTTSGQELLTLKGPTGAVRSVAFSPDGQRLAAAGGGRAVMVWNAASGQEMLTLKGHTCVAFSPDGKRLASAGGDQTVKIWDTTSGQETLTLKGHTSGVRSVAFSADGKRLAVAGVKTVKVWDVSNRANSTGTAPSVPANTLANKLEGDLKALQGEWQLVDYQSNPPLEAAGLALLKSWKCTISGDTFTRAGQGFTQRSTFKLDPTQKPKAIDLTPLDGTLKGKTILGIYSIDGETLKLSLTERNVKRPTEFKPDEGRNQTVMVFQRAASAAVSPSTPTNGNAASNPPVTGDLKALQGDWHVVEFQTDPPTLAIQVEQYKKMALTIAGDVMTLWGTDVNVTNTIQLDTTQNPKAIDMISKAGGPAGTQSTLGIYLLEGETLKLVMAQKTRPTSFNLEQGSKQALTVYQRGRPAGLENAQFPEDKFDHKAWERVQPTLEQIGLRGRLIHRFQSPDMFPEGVLTTAEINLPFLLTGDTYPENLISTLKLLSHVTLVGQAMDDARLKQLSELPGLIGLTLIRNGKFTITASGLSHLKRSPQLRSLNLNAVSLTPELMKVIGELSNLRSLSIIGIPVTDDLLPIILQLKELEFLSLGSTQLTDSGVAQLAKLSNLKFLDLSATKVTDQGLPSLKGLSKLQILGLRKLNVSPQAVDELQKALPGCKILK